MTNQKKARLIEAGVDLPRALERFMNQEALYEKFLLQFPQDSNYIQLVEAIEQGDEKKAEIAAHTLKGVSGNLGFTALMLQLDDLVRRLRNGEPCSQLTELMGQITADYTLLCTALQENEEVI